MPNRIIKDSVKRSREIDMLSWFEEVVFYRLIVTADDYGRLDARPVLLLHDLFPLKENVSSGMLQDAVNRLIEVGLVQSYVADGEPYLFFPKWEKHQTIRNKFSRYPEPTADCMQMISDCKQPSAKCCDESESKTESESNTNPKPKEARAPAREAAAAAPEKNEDLTEKTEDYVRKIIPKMTRKQLAELQNYRFRLPDDLIVHAVDEAANQGVRTWAYVCGILNRYEEQGIESVEEAAAEETRHRKRARAPAAGNPALDYQQRELSESDYGEGFFVNLEEYAPSG